MAHHLLNHFLTIKTRSWGSRSSLELLPSMARPWSSSPSSRKGNRVLSNRTIVFQSQGFRNQGPETFLSPLYLAYWLLVPFTGSNLLAIRDAAENSFLLEELLAFGSSVQMVWLNAQFDNNSKCHGCRGGASKHAVLKASGSPRMPLEHNCCENIV